MNDILKGILIAFVIVYIVSPIDLCPGSLVDDLLVFLLNLGAQKRLTSAAG